VVRPLCKKAGGRVTPAAYRPGRRVQAPVKRSHQLTPEGFGAGFYSFPESII